MWSPQYMCRSFIIPDCITHACTHKSNHWGAGIVGLLQNWLNIHYIVSDPCRSLFSGTFCFLLGMLVVGPLEKKRGQMTYLDVICGLSQALCTSLHAAVLKLWISLRISWVHAWWKLNYYGAILKTLVCTLCCITHIIILWVQLLKLYFISGVIEEGLFNGSWFLDIVALIVGSDDAVSEHYLGHSIYITC